MTGPVSEKTIEISYIANAGVCIKTNKATFLVDAIHHEGDYPFSKVPADTLAAMKRGSGPYANADYLLFTHTHPDHFTPEHVISYLRNNSSKALFVHSDKLQRTQPVFSVCRERGITAVPLRVDYGALQQFQLNQDAVLTSLSVHHLKEEYADVACGCLMLEVCGKRILLLADADHGRSEEFFPLGESADIAFVNPYCLLQPAGRVLLENILKPKQIAVYHIPFAEDDRLGMRMIVQNLQKRYQHKYSSMIALLHPSMKIRL